MKRDREMSDEGGRRREEAPLTVSLPLCGIAGEDAHVPPWMLTICIGVVTSY